MLRKGCVLLVLVLLVMSSTVYASTGVDYNSEADLLNSYGLFSGTDKGYELQRVPSRVEAAAMLVKLLGKEEDAKLNHYAHPFTDVPSWANDIIGYMYHKKMTTGIGSNLFGSKQPMKANDFTVFALKALGYSTEDFSYAETMNFAVEIGLFDENTRKELESVEFKRDEMVHISAQAIKANVKGEDLTLFDRLDTEGVNKKGSNATASTADLFLAGKTTKYEKTIKNIDTSGDTLTIDTDVVTFKFAKKDGIISVFDYAQPIIISQDPLVEEWQRIIRGTFLEGKGYFKKTFNQWTDDVIYYNIALFKDGVYQLSFDFVSITTQGYETSFELPTTNFDELKLTAYPVDETFFGKSVDDFAKFYKSSEVDKIMSLVTSGKAISIVGSGVGMNYFDTLYDLKQEWMLYSYGGSHFSNGEYISSMSSFDEVPKFKLNYDVKFTSEGFPQLYKVTRDKNNNPIGLTYTFRTSNLEDDLAVYFIFDEEFKVINVMFITE